MYTVLKAIAGYFFLLLTVRVLTRRPGAQMTPFEFVLIFLIGGAIILATVGDDRSMINAVCAVTTVGLLHRTIAGLKQRFPRFAALVDGTPLFLVQDGEWNWEVMNRMHVQPADVMAAARTKGMRSFAQVEAAVLERNGAISILSPKE